MSDPTDPEPEPEFGLTEAEIAKLQGGDTSMIDVFGRRMQTYFAARAVHPDQRSPLTVALVEAVEAGDVPAVVAVLHGPSQKARTEAAEQLTRSEPRLSWWKHSIYIDEDTPVARAASLARLGLCGMNDLAYELEGRWVGAGVALDVIEARGKGFARRVVAHLLSRGLGTGGRVMLRGLMSRGLVGRPDDEDYLPIIARQVTERFVLEGAEPMVAWLRSEPDLVDEVWAVLERAPQFVGTYFKPWHTRTSGGEQGVPRTLWEDVLPALRSAGIVERDRLVDLAIEQLSTDCGVHRWLGVVLDREDLDSGEQRRALAAYLRTTTLADPVAQKEGIDRIAALAKAEVVADPSDLAEALRRPLVGSQKNTAAAALRLLERAAADPTAVVPALEAVALGVGHTRADVQERALKVLEKRWPADAGDARRVADALARQLPDVAPTHRPAVDGLIARGGAMPAAAPAPAPTGPAPADTFDGSDIVDAARIIDRDIPELGLGSAADAVDHGDWPAPAVFRADAGPVLSSERAAATPVADADELVALCAGLLEGEVDGIDVERALDGLARLGAAIRAESPGHLQAITARAGVRLRPFMGVRGSEPVNDGRRLASDAAAMVQVWAQGPDEWTVAHLASLPGGRRQSGPAQTPAPDQRWRAATPYAFVADRMLEVAVRAHAGTAAPLLATPTHAGGWIDVQTLRERLIALDDAGVEPGPLDVVAAGLRAVGHWSTVRAAGTQAARTIAAAMEARAAEPPLPIDAAPLTVLPAARTDTGYKGNALALDPTSVVVDDVPPFRRSDPVAMVLHRLLVDARARSPWEGQPVFGAREVSTSELAVMTIPTRPDLWSAAALIATTVAIEDTESFARPDHAMLAGVDPDVPLGRLGSIATAFLVVARPPELAAAGLDLLLAGAGDGRLDPAALGEGWAHLHGVGTLRCGRLTAPLTEAVRASELHATVVLRALEAFLARVGDVPQNVHAPIEVLVEAGTTVGTGVADPAARASLDRVVASSKGAKRSKAAAAALALPIDEPRRGALRHMALAAQVERGRRWAGLLA